MYIFFIILILLSQSVSAFKGELARACSFRLHNVAPPGSKYIGSLEFIETDPATNYPWAFEDKKWATITRDMNPGYHFLTDEWAYMKHEFDPNNPAGVIMGGPENYTGMGLKLKGKDRQRIEPRPYIYDHGHKWREKVPPGRISFDISPDCNQEVGLYDEESDLVTRTWGSWTQEGATLKMKLDNAFRGYYAHGNKYELVYPLTNKYEEYQTWPLYYDKPSTTLNPPPIEWLLAALGRFIGYSRDPNADEDRVWAKQKKLILEWDEAEAMWKKTRKKLYLKRIKHIKKMLFNPKQMVPSNVPERRIEYLAQEVAMENARRILKDQINDKARDPDYIRKLHNQVDISFDSGSINAPEAEQMTECINLVGFDPYPMPDSYQENMTVEEMAEAYHKYMIEIRGEGRHYLMDEIPVEDDDVQYALRNKIFEFPGLVAQYRPIWSNKKYGDEFGGAIPDKHIIPKDLLTTFGAKLKKLEKVDLDTLNYPKDFDSYSEANKPTDEKNPT